MQIITVGKNRYDFPDEVSRDEIESIIDRDNKGSPTNLEPTDYASVALDLARPTQSKMESLGIGAAKGVAPSAAFLGGMGAGAALMAPLAPVTFGIAPVVGGLVTGSLAAWGASTAQEYALDKILDDDTKKYIAEKEQENPGYTRVGSLIASGFKPSLTIEKTALELLKNRGAPAALGGAITAGTEVWANRNEPGLVREGAGERIMEAAAEMALLNQTTRAGKALEGLGGRLVPDKLVRGMEKIAGTPPRPPEGTPPPVVTDVAATTAETDLAETNRRISEMLKRNDAMYEAQLREEGRAEGSDARPRFTEPKDVPPPISPDELPINREFDKQDVINREERVAEMAEEARIKAVQELQRIQELEYKQKKEDEALNSGEPPPSNVIAGPDTPIENLIGTRVTYGEITGILIRDAEGKLMVMPEVRNKSDAFWHEVEGGGNAVGDPDIRAADLRIVPLEPAKATVKRPPEVPPIPEVPAVIPRGPLPVSPVSASSPPPRNPFITPVELMPNTGSFLYRGGSSPAEGFTSPYLSASAELPSGGRVPSPVADVSPLTEANLKLQKFIAPEIAAQKLPPKVPVEKPPVDSGLVQDIAEKKAYLDELLATKEITPELHAEEIAINDRRLTNPATEVAPPVAPAPVAVTEIPVVANKATAVKAKPASDLATDPELREAANSQRGIPEATMMRFTENSALGTPAALKYQLEHIGDLSHRLQEPRFTGSFARSKIENLMAKLFPTKGGPTLEELMDQGYENNSFYQVTQNHPELFANLKGREQGELMRSRPDLLAEQAAISAKIKADTPELLKEYVEAHQKENLPVTYAGKLGKEAAIALGKMDFSRLRTVMMELDAVFKKHGGTTAIYRKTIPKGSSIAEVIPSAVKPVAKASGAEAYSKNSLKSAFNLTDKQATATDILVKSMGLDESQILVAKGGKAGRGSLKQVEGILSGKEKAPQFETRDEAVKFIKDYATKNRVIPEGLELMSSEGRSTAIDAIVKHTLGELYAWKEIAKDYVPFYTTDIVTRTNPKLQENALRQYGRKLTNSEIAFNHLLSAFGSGQAEPTLDTALGMRVFDEYMRTGKATGYSDKPKPVYKAPSVGKTPMQVYVDAKTGADTFVSRGNSPKFDSSRKAQISRTYNVSGLERFNNVLDHFKGDLDSTMQWLGSQHTWPEITEVIGSKAADSLKPHEYLNKKGETFGVFTLGNNPKLGSYILNRWQNLGTITKDMWVARTMSRYFNEPNTGIPWATTSVGRNKRVILDGAWGEVAKRLGVEPAQVQEMMWDAEKRFYGIIGQASEGAYTSTGVEREMAKRIRENPTSAGSGMSSGEGTVLSQGTKGAYELTSDGKALIRGFESADVSTASHEIAHVARRQLLDRGLKPEQRAGITNEDIAYAETWSGAKKGVWSKSAEEKFARGFEKYLRDGQAPTKGLQSVFSKFANWLSGIYQTLVGSAIDIKVSPKMKMVFDQMVTRSERLKLGVTPASEGVIKTPSVAAKPRGSFPSAKDRGAINVDMLSSLGQTLGGGTAGFAYGYNKDPDASKEEKVSNGIQWALFGAALGTKALRSSVLKAITTAKIPLGRLPESIRDSAFGGANNFVIFTKGVLGELQTSIKSQSSETAALAYNAIKSLDAMESMRGKVSSADWNAAMAHLGNRGSPSLIADRKLQSLAKIVRTEIDDFTLDMLGRGYAESGSDLEATLIFNNGKYLTRTYELFTNPDFKPDPKLRDKVVSEYVDQARAEGSTKPTSELEIEGLAMAIGIVAKKEGSALAPKGANLAMGNGYARTDGSIFKPRKNLSDTISKYMGRIDDPIVAASYTVDRMAHFLGASITQSKMRDVGLAMELFSETPNAKYTVPVSEVSSENTRGPLARLYTTPEVSDALRTLSSYGKNGPLVRVLASTTGMMKIANTALNPESFPPNVIGSVVAVLSQGSAAKVLLNPIKMGGTALKISFSDILPVKTETLNNDVQFLIREQILRQGVNAQDVVDTFKNSVFNNMGRPSNAILLSATKGVKKVGSGMLNAYQKMEEVPRLIGFYAEVNKYSDALYNRLPEQLTTAERLVVYKKAATIVRENYPNYAEVPEVLRLASLSGGLPPFVSWQYEAFVRNPYNTVLRAKTEMAEGFKTGNKKLTAMGVNRLSWFIGTMVGSVAIATAMNKKQGLSDDQEEAARYFMPPWDKNSPLVFPEVTNEEIAYANQSYLNPQAVLGQAIDDAIKGKTPVEATYNFLKSLGNNFISDGGLLIKPMSEAISGTDSYGNKVYTENAGGLFDVSKLSGGTRDAAISAQQFVERYIIHGFKNIVPRAIKVADKYIKASNDEVGPNGQVYKIDDLNSRMMGLRINRMGLKATTENKAASLSGEMYEATTAYSRARNAKNVTPKSLDVAYNLYEQQRYAVWLKMQEYLQRGSVLGRPQQELLDNLSGVDTGTKIGLITDVYTPADKEKTLSARDRLEALQNLPEGQRDAEWASLVNADPREARKIMSLIREETREDLRGLTGPDKMLQKLDHEERAMKIAILLSKIPDQNEKEMEWDRLSSTGLLKGRTGAILTDQDSGPLVWAEARATLERNLKRGAR